MAWLGEHRAVVVEEFIQNGGSSIITQRDFRIRFALSRQLGVKLQPGSALKRNPENCCHSTRKTHRIMEKYR
jgi:hypothetical protein